MHCFKPGEASGSDGGQSAGSKPGLQAVQGGKSLLLLTTPAASRPPGAPPLARHRAYAPVSPSAGVAESGSQEAWLPDSPWHTQCNSLCFNAGIKSQALLACVSSSDLDTCSNTLMGVALQALQPH